jgi:hypothetical protein
MKLWMIMSIWWVYCGHSFTGILRGSSIKTLMYANEEMPVWCGKDGQILQNNVPLNFKSGFFSIFGLPNAGKVIDCLNVTYGAHHIITCKPTHTSKTVNSVQSDGWKQGIYHITKTTGNTTQSNGSNNKRRVSVRVV